MVSCLARIYFHCDRSTVSIHKVAVRYSRESRLYEIATIFPFFITSSERKSSISLKIRAYAFLFVVVGSTLVASRPVLFAGVSLQFVHTLRILSRTGIFRDGSWQIIPLDRGVCFSALPGLTLFSTIPIVVFGLCVDAFDYFLLQNHVFHPLHIRSMQVCDSDPLIFWS